MLTKYTQNKLCIKLVFLYTILRKYQDAEIFRVQRSSSDISQFLCKLQRNIWRRMRKHFLSAECCVAFGTWSSATIASSCPSVRKEQLCFHWTVFQDIWYLNIFRKSVSLKSDNNNRYFTFMTFLLFLLRRRNVSRQSCRENQNTHFMFGNVFFLRKSYRVRDNVK